MSERSDSNTQQLVNHVRVFGISSADGLPPLQ